MLIKNVLQYFNFAEEKIEVALTTSDPDSFFYIWIRICIKIKWIPTLIIIFINVIAQ